MPFDKRFNPDELRQLLQNKYGPGVQVEVFPKSQQEQTDESDEAPSGRQDPLHFDYRPSQIKEYLDRFIIQQDDAKKVLATAVCDHYHHIQSCRGEKRCREYKKQNIILIGPTGVGKTYLIQNIADLIGVPFVKADATKYSETGYVGGDVEDLVRDLVQQADGDIGLAECGIIYLDEVDKLATSTNTLGRDVSGHGVQRGLLKLMEETEVPLRSPTDVASQMQAFMEFQNKGKIDKKTINTKHILFIVSGAFTGLSDIIRRRIGARQIGFMGAGSSAEEEHYLLGKGKSVDFIEYGFEAEFIGRLPVTVHCNHLSTEDLFHILKFSEGSLLKQYKRDFQAYGIEVYFTDGGMRKIAEQAESEQTGARGLITVCERILREYKYQLPDSSVKEFVVDEGLVEERHEKLKELLENPRMHRPRILQFQVSKVENEFKDRFGLDVKFTPGASELIAQNAQKSGKGLLNYCQDLFRDYEHGLNLLRKVPNKGPFVFDEEVVQNPSGVIDRWIREAYR